MLPCSILLAMFLPSFEEALSLTAVPLSLPAAAA
jgi:hypothetical protein